MAGCMASMSRGDAKATRAGGLTDKRATAVRLVTTTITMAQRPQVAGGTGRLGRLIVQSVAQTNMESHREHGSGNVEDWDRAGALQPGTDRPAYRRRRLAAEAYAPPRVGAVDRTRTALRARAGKLFRFQGTKCVYSGEGGAIATNGGDLARGRLISVQLRRMGPSDINRYQRHQGTGDPVAPSLRVTR